MSIVNNTFLCMIYKFTTSNKYLSTSFHKPENPTCERNIFAFRCLVTDMILLGFELYLVICLAVSQAKATYYQILTATIFLNDTGWFFFLRAGAKQSKKTLSVCLHVSPLKAVMTNLQKPCVVKHQTAITQEQKENISKHSVCLFGQLESKLLFGHSYSVTKRRIDLI